MRALLPATFLILALTAPLRGQTPDRLLPSRPEIHVAPQLDGDVLYSLRGKDCRASDFLSLLVGTGKVAVIVDKAAQMPLTSTILTVDLHERHDDFIVDLIAAAAGVDAERDLNVFRLMGPPRPGMGTVRTGLRWSAEKFYNLALMSQRDTEVTALTYRGLAELHRKSDDFMSAMGVYETLLARFPHSKASEGCELLLADCYLSEGDRVRAAKILRSFLDHCEESHLRDRALRRLLTVLIETTSFREIEDLREGLRNLDVILPPTLRKLSDAAAMMIEAGRSEAAIMLLNDIWLDDPQLHAVLGPVLALALVAQKQPDPSAAATVLRLSMSFLEDQPDSATALMAYAELADRAKMVPAALVFASSAQRCDDAGPTVLLRSHLLLGRIYRRLGLILRARRHFYEAEQLSSREEAARLALSSAEMALEEGEPERARLLFRDTLGQESVRPEAEIGIARALLAAGEPQRAITILRDMTVEEIPEKLVEPRLLLAVDCLEQLGDYEKARRLLNGDLTAMATEENP